MEIPEDSTPGRMMDFQKRLDRIEAFANGIHVPLALFKEVYTLEEHVDLVARGLPD